jgi:hypothetical protein
VEGQDWAQQEFGAARLGDARRVNRLVKVAAAAAARPSGYVSEVALSDAERTGAYRLVNNHEVRVDDVTRAARDACIQRAAGLPFVFVAEDGSSITLGDGPGWRQTGVVGTYTQGARGFIVMNAVVLAPDGTPLGVGAQRWWSRAEEPLDQPAHKRRPEQKEVRHWVDVADAVASDFAAANAPRPWFQLDRGADAWYVLDEAVKRDWWVTVRSSSDRRLDAPADADARTVREALRATSAITSLNVELPSGPGRAARVAELAVHATPVTLRLTDDRTERRWPRAMWAVWVREPTPPHGVEPLEWVLLTTRPVASAEDAVQTVQGYRLRWRVEEFHRSWKSAGCDVELTQLSTAHAVQVWASILASVAVRILRMTYLSRSAPETPASVEFSDDEITAAYLMNKKKRDRRQMPTIAEVTWLIAKGGGHAPSRKGKAPGAEVIARGLERHAVWVEAMHVARREREM